MIITMFVRQKNNKKGNSKMLVFTLKYSKDSEGINLSRTIADDADIATVVGEMLYAVETITKSFSTHDLFEQATIPEKITLNQRILTYETEDVVVTISASKKKK